MARAKKKTVKKTKVAKKTPTSKRTYSLGDRFSSKVQRPSSPAVWKRIKSDWTANSNINQNSFSMVLGALIVIILAVLFFNYFNKPVVNSPQTSSSSTEQAGDVSKDSLPGKYTVKDGDTLFTIAQKYYDNGYLFPKISEANQLSDENTLQVGQVLEIPKVDTTAQATPAPTPSESPVANDQNTLSSRTQPVQGGTGGATNQTEWGQSITGTTYTVQPGDWLSTIAGRAYGDVFAYTKIAQANKISDPNVIEPGMVLQIPR